MKLENGQLRTLFGPKKSTEADGGLRLRRDPAPRREVPGQLRADGDGCGVLGVVVRDDGHPTVETVQPAARGDLRVRPQRRLGLAVLFGTGNAACVDAMLVRAGADFAIAQVCHHPPIVGQYCESTSGKWKAWQEFSMRSKFKGV